MPGYHRVPTDRPLIVQVFRFDRWKDPMGVIEAFRLARKQIDGTLVLVGNNATDDYVRHYQMLLAGERGQLRVAAAPSVQA